MRLLCINPNTTHAMTEKVIATLRPLLPADAEIVAETARFGAPTISTRASFAIGGHAALEAFARRAREPWDCVLLACFGDPALQAIQEVATVPVHGMAEASMLLATRARRRFSIVTGGAAWRPMLHEFATLIGCADHLVSIRTTVATGGDIFRDPDGARAELLAAITACIEDGAESVILGGAGLAGLAEGFRSLVSVPIIDPVEALATIALGSIASDRMQGLCARPSPAAADLLDAGWL